MSFSCNKCAIYGVVKQYGNSVVLFPEFYFLPRLFLPGIAFLGAGTGGICLTLALHIQRLYHQLIRRVAALLKRANVYIEN